MSSGGREKAGVAEAVAEASTLDEADVMVDLDVVMFALALEADLLRLATLEANALDRLNE